MGTHLSALNTRTLGHVVTWLGNCGCRAGAALAVPPPSLPSLCSGIPTAAAAQPACACCEAARSCGCPSHPAGDHHICPASVLVCHRLFCPCVPPSLHPFGHYIPSVTIFSVMSPVTMSLSHHAPSTTVQCHCISCHCGPFITMTLCQLSPCPITISPLSPVIHSLVTMFPPSCIPSVTMSLLSPHSLSYLLLPCPSVTMLHHCSMSLHPLCHYVPSVMVSFYHCVLCHISFVTVSSVTVSLLPPHPDMSCYHVPSHHIPSPYSFCHVPCHCSPLSLSLLSLSPSVTMFLLPPYHLSLHPSCVPSATTSLLSMYPSVTLEGLLGGVSASDLLGLPQEPPQPLNLTAKPKAPELPSTTSSPSLKMSSCGPRPPSHGAPTRDLQSSPPSLPLGKLLSRAWFFPSWGTRGPPLRVLA